MKPGIDAKYQAMSLDELLGECQRLDDKVKHLENVVRSFQNVAEQYQFTQFAIDNLAMGAFWATEDASLTYVNQAACRMLGYSQDELLQMKVPDIDVNIQLEEWPDLWSNINQKKQIQAESFYQRKGGELIPVEIIINSVQFQGIPFHCGFVRDISHERKAREALDDQFLFSENLIDMAPVMVLVLDQEGRIVRINAHTTEVTGYTQEEVKGAYFSRFFFKNEYQSAVEALIAKKLKGLPQRKQITRLTTKTDTSKEIFWYGRLLKNSDNEVQGILIIGQDITESREMESRLHQSEKMEAIGLLAGGLAHDFNNQLGGIMGYAEVLQDHVEENSDILVYVQKIIHAIENASKVTEQLLTFSRKGSFLSENIEINRIINDIVEILKHSIDKRIEIKQQLFPGGTTVLGDASQVQNAILNLAINARDAMPDGGQLCFETRRITLSSPSTEIQGFVLEPGEYIQVIVSDTGIGMTPVDQQRIFEPFFTTKDNKKNSGMGLSMVFGTIKRHTGAIQVSSKPNTGTEITLYFPCSRPVTIVDECRDIIKTVLPSADNIQVLLAEDEQILQQVATEMLKRLGCHVTVCRDGVEAVGCLEKHPHNFDVIIVDMNMPNLGGRDAFLKMKEINPDIAVILSSGYSLDQEVQHLLDNGAKAFIQKPFRKRELSLAIAEACGSVGD